MENTLHILPAPKFIPSADVVSIAAEFIAALVPVVVAEVKAQVEQQQPAPATPDNDYFITAAEAAKRLSVREALIASWGREGLLRAHPIGPHYVRFKWAEVLADLGLDGGQQ